MPHSHHHLPLHEYVVVSKYLKCQLAHKALLLLRTLLSASFLCYRLLTCTSFCFLALACEATLAIYTLLPACAKWFPVERDTHPERLISMRSPQDQIDLPAVDVFITTADPFKEPPLITMNTVLSVLAVDFPVEKVACYVSDDGGSILTFYALQETAKFARKWVPFCKRYRAEPRAPAAYFRRMKTSDSAKDEDHFAGALQAMKVEYDLFQRRLNNAVEAYRDGGSGRIELLLEGSTSSWAAANNPSDHPPVFQIVVEKPEIPYGDALPCLTYISREKRPKHKHHFKAGAMNALTRVSGIMTNAPFILNLDCDMHVNDSKAILRAMCFFMDSDTNKHTSFVQFPQCFAGVDEGDIYGNNLKTEMQLTLKGMDGLQGPPYLGTGCVHKREALYGQRPHAKQEYYGYVGGQKAAATTVTSDPYQYAKENFGRSSPLVVCAQSILGGRNDKWLAKGDDLTKEATQLISCTYEDATHWGSEIGWIYGSATEDVLTGLKIHCRGWKSVYCVPSPPAFVGRAPTSSEDALTTRKRWSIGALEILFSKHSPALLRHSDGLSLLQRMAYLWFSSYPLICFPILLYAMLPAICLITRRSIFPQVHDPAIMISICLFLTIYGLDYYEHTFVEVGVMEWWNIKRMDAIVSVSSHAFATMEVVLMKMGISDAKFVVTPKDENMSLEESNKMGFGVKSNSPLFIAPTVLVLVNG